MQKPNQLLGTQRVYILLYSEAFKQQCETSDINADWIKWKDFFLGAAVKHIPQKWFKKRSTPYGSTAK
jgi:hypothetical protein